MTPKEQPSKSATTSLSLEIMPWIRFFCHPRHRRGHSKCPDPPPLIAIARQVSACLAMRMDCRRCQAKRARCWKPNRASFRKDHVHHAVQGNEAQASAPGWSDRKTSARSSPRAVWNLQSRVTRRVALPRAAASVHKPESGSQQSSTKPHPSAEIQPMDSTDMREYGLKASPPTRDTEPNPTLTCHGPLAATAKR